MSLLGPPDLSSTVSRFAFPVTRYRFGASTTNALGYRSPGAVTETAITAHVSPPGAGITSEMLPQGAVLNDSRLAWTTTECRVASTETGSRGDEIGFAGERYKVVGVRPYRKGADGSASHFELLLLRVDRADPSPLPTDP